VETRECTWGGERGINRPTIRVTEHRLPTPSPGVGSVASLPSVSGGGWGSPTGASKGHGGRAPRRSKRRLQFECPLCGKVLRSKDSYHIEKHLRELKDAGFIKVERMHGGWAVVCGNRVYVGAG